MNDTHDLLRTPLPQNAGFAHGYTNQASQPLGPPITPSAPSVRATMSMDELARAQAQIAAVVEERDQLRNHLQNETTEHNRTKDRVTLVQNELEKAQADRDTWMRVATKFATLVASIHDLSLKAKAIADGVDETTGKEK